MKIYTGNYENCKVSDTISISEDTGKEVGFKGPFIRELIPKCSWEQVWRDTIEVLNEAENLRLFVESYYETVLKSLDPGYILSQLKEGSILLCHEDPKKISHRHLVAAWLELFYGIEVREVKILEDGKMKVLPRNKYYSIIKDMLDTLIKNDIDMHGYTSIAANYAYERAKKVADDPKLCDELGVSPEMYIILASALENKYRISSMKK